MADKNWRDYSKYHSSKKSKKDSEKEQEKKNSGTGDWRNYSKFNVSNEVGTNITDRVNSWLTNHSSYVSDYQKRYSGRKGTYEDSYVSDSASWLDKVSKQKSSFDAEADSILAYMDQYKGYLDAKWMDDVRKTIAVARDQQKGIYDSAVSDNQWWSSFGSEDLVKQYGSAEDAYKYYQRGDGYNKKYEGKTLDELQTALDAIPDGEEKDWLAYNMTSLAKGTLSKNADWAERSKYKSTYRGGEKFNAFSGMYTDTGYDDITYDYINRDEKARKRQLVNDIASDASFLGLDTSYVDGKFAAVERELADQRTFNATQIGTISCIQGQIAQLYGLTKLVVPNSSVCPGWTTTTTGA